MPGAGPTEYAIRLGLWLAARRRHPHPDNTTLVARDPLDRTTSAYMIAESDVAAVLDENARMREERGELVRLLRAAFSAGWALHESAAMAALCSVGIDQREQQGQQYVAELIEDWHAVQQQRDTPCVCGCGRPDDDTNMCHCPTPCPCEPDCAFCLAPNPMREHAPGGEAP
jgi:hypothetical protein